VRDSFPNVGEERIEHSYGVTGQPILQNIGEEERAILQLGGCDDHGVTPLQLESPLDCSSLQEQVAVYRLWVPGEQRSNVFERFIRCETRIEVPGDRQVILIQNLDARASALLDPQLFKPRSGEPLSLLIRRIPGLDEDARVNENGGAQAADLALETAPLCARAPWAAG
jgi:hypothetical protein